MTTTSSKRPTSDRKAETTPGRKAFAEGRRPTSDGKAETTPGRKAFAEGQRLTSDRKPKTERKSFAERKAGKTSEYPVAQAVPLLEFLLQTLDGQSRTTVKSLLSHQQVKVNQTVVRQFDHMLRAGDKVEINWDKGQDTLKHPKLKILYEDSYIIVVEKGAGLLSVGTSREREKTAYSILSDYVKRKSPGNKIFVVHRLDRETSGVMLFARHPDIQQQMQDNWRFAVSQRQYVAVLEGRLQTGDGSGRGTVTSYLWESKACIVYASNNPDEGVRAVTHYQVLKSNDRYSLVSFRLDTGRKNQIRVQMNSIGYPVAGDLKYGGHRTRMNRMALHACALSFTHPVSGEKMSFETPVPDEFHQMVE